VVRVTARPAWALGGKLRIVQDVIESVAPPAGTVQFPGEVCSLRSVGGERSIANADSAQRRVCVKLIDGVLDDAARLSICSAVLSSASIFSARRRINISFS
jgi:hypothetical protein